MYYQSESESGAAAALGISFFPYRNTPNLIFPKCNSGDGYCVVTSLPTGSHASQIKAGIQTLIIKAEADLLLLSFLFFPKDRSQVVFKIEIHVSFRLLPAYETPRHSPSLPSCSDFTELPSLVLSFVSSSRNFSFFCFFPPLYVSP